MIIIETPAPPTLERLVLVPADAVSRTASEPALDVHTSAGRDATPADLARGGYVPLAAQPDPGTLAHLRADLRDAVRRAEHAEQLTSELQATIARAFSYIEHTPGVQYLDAEVKKLGERAEKAEGLLIQRETELRLAREDGDERARDLRQAYERAVAAAEKAEAELADLRPAPRGMTVREAARARHALGGPDAQALEGALVQAERERDEAIRRGIECIGAGPTNIENVVARLVNIVEASRGIEKDYAARLKAAETELARLMQERDTLRAEVAEASKALLEAGCVDVLPLAERVAMLVDERAGMRADLRGAKELARVLEVERDTARAELARLTAPGEGSEGEPTYEALGEHYRNAWDASEAMLEMGRRHDAYAALYRLGVAHERARQQPAKDRATDEELAQVYRKIYETHGGGTISVSHDDCRRAGVRAVADRVRQERCLVAQAVAMGVSLEIGPHSKGVDIHVSRPRENADGGEFFEGELVEAGRDDVPPSEASATLARLLGEVSRG